MKIKLKEGKQKELIFLAKKDKTWRELAELIEVPQSYIEGDLRREKNILSENLYNKLCNISGIRFDEYIIEKLNDNWGQSKGGINSRGSTIQLIKPKFSLELAEFVGAVLGDGHVCSYSLNKGNRKTGTYCIKIAGDLTRDKDYHLYLKKLSAKLFNLKPKEILKLNHNERFLNLASKELVNFFIEMDIHPGNKIANQSTIPKWVYSNNNYLKACIRGLIDTDGSIHRMSQRDFKLLRINFTNCNIKLLKYTREAFIILGFNPTKIINNQQFYLSRQNEIEKYLKEINFSNKKHLDRLKAFKSPVF